jgi:hypothetical protein
MKQNKKDKRLLDLSKRPDCYSDRNKREVEGLSPIRKVENLSPKRKVEGP